MFKRLIWRALRGSVAAVIAAFLADYAAKYGIDPTTVAGLGTGILLALDKLFRDSRGR